MQSQSPLFRFSMIALGVAAALGGSAAVQAADAAAADEQAGQEIDEVVVTGFRASLQNSVADKREKINFTDSIFAEDIGKFPDLNLAEALQRIPGVQIARDVTGEGTSVAVRGLGRDFTQITLNGAPIETASDSNIDSVSQGRGLDLVLFPTELFRQLTVSKTPVASQQEGAVAANIDLRLARPFDEKGFHLNYTAKGTYQESGEEWSPRLGVYASNTWDTSAGEFGILGGVAYSNRKYRSDGFNTFHLTNVSLGDRCPTGTVGCNNFANPNTTTPRVGYGNTNQSFPTTVPATGYTFGANGATPGGPLTVCGPGATPGGTSGLSCNDLSYALWPRLARPDSLVGERETTSGVLSAQWASPNDTVSIYFDSIYSKADHPYERNDLNLAIRSIGTNIPVNVTLNEDKVVTHATIANPIWLNENRPYREVTDFMNFNTGFEWAIAEKWKMTGSVNYNHSDWFRSTNTYLFDNALGTGITVDIDNSGDGVWTVTPSRDLNDLGLNNGQFWRWNTLRIQPVQREVYQKGGRLALTWGDEKFNVGAGASQDYFHREITTWDVSTCATGGTAPAGCAAALARDGVLPATAAVPNAQLVNYLQNWTHGPLFQTADFNVGINNGWALPNYSMLDPAVNIDYLENELAVNMVGGMDLSGWTPRMITEETTTFYIEANGMVEDWHNFRYNIGVRRPETEQNVKGIVSVVHSYPQPGNPGFTITERQLQSNDTEYHKYLPSFNVSVELTEGVILRAAGSKTMTRPNPTDVAPNESLNVNADTLTKGNPDLSPYFANNGDLGIEWYFGETGLGVVAASFWAKRLDGFTSTVGVDVPFSTLGIDYNSLPPAAQASLTTRGNGNPQNALVRVNQRQNTDEVIHLYGWELTYVQPLDFMLQGSGVSINYTNISQYSTGGLPNAPSSAVTGLSPYTYNVTAFYENHGFSGRVAYSVRDDYLSFLGNNDQNIAGDNFAQKSGYLDASFSYKLPMDTDLSISLELQNILNEQQLTLFRNDDYMPRTAFAPGRQILLGVFGSF